MLTLQLNVSSVILLCWASTYDDRYSWMLCGNFLMFMVYSDFNNKLCTNHIPHKNDISKFQTEALKLKHKLSLQTKRVHLPSVRLLRSSVVSTGECSPANMSDTHDCWGSPLSSVHRVHREVRKPPRRQACQLWVTAREVVLCVWVCGCCVCRSATLQHTPVRPPRLPNTAIREQHRQPLLLVT